MDASGLVVLKRVIENAKRYFSNPKAFEEAWQEEMGDDEE